MRDIVSNLEILPWILLTVLFFIFSIVFLLHTKYSFTYKKPTYVIIFILFAIVFVSGFIVDNFKMHDIVKGRIDRRPIPGMREMYRENKKDLNRGVKEKIINY
jgi:glucan phosphoethanolaminetransferase (alkaline phosphatase superfamily)